MPPSLTVVIAITTVLLLIGAGCTWLLLSDDYFVTIPTVAAIPMVAAALATLVLGSSQAGIGLSVGLRGVLLADFILLLVSAFFTWAYLADEVFPAAGVALSVLMLAASFGIVAFVFHEQSREDLAARVAVVASYLDALKTGDFDAAYRTLCQSDRQRESLQAFVQRQMALPQILDYEIQGDEVLGQPRQESLRMQIPPIYVPPSPPPPVILPPPPDPIEVDLRFTDGTSRKEAYASTGPGVSGKACVGAESQVPAEDGAPE